MWGNKDVRNKMSTVYADTLEPSVPTKNTTLGATGDSITIGGDSINTNVIQDSGGNVLFQSDGKVMWFRENIFH